MAYSFTARQVTDVTGMSRPVLADLVKRDVIEPSKHRGTGRGDNHLFDLFDVFGIAAVQFLRPKAETTGLLRSLFKFWRSEVGRRIVEGTSSVSGVVVLDDSGKVTLEKDMPVTELAARRDAAVLYVIEPRIFAQKLFAEVALHRMAGDHAQPGPSGREPRTRKATAGKRLPNRKLPALLREALEREASTKRRAKQRGKS